MKRIALFFFIFLTPMLAMDEEINRERYHKRAQYFEAVMLTFNKEIDVALGIREDIFNLAMQQTRDKPFKFNTFSFFNDEFEALLGLHTLPPEKLLEGYEENGLKRLNDNIALFENFIEKWRRTADFSKGGVQVAINILRDHQIEWESFAKELAVRVRLGLVSDSDMRRMYTMISTVFFKWPTDLKRTLILLQDQWGKSLPTCLFFLRDTLSYLEEIYYRKGKVLWEILMYELFKRGVDLSKFPEDYSMIDSNYFLDANNPVKEAIDSILQENLDPTAVESLLGGREPSAASAARNHSPKRRSPAASAAIGISSLRIESAADSPATDRSHKRGSPPPSAAIAIHSSSNELLADSPTTNTSFASDSSASSPVRSRSLPSGSAPASPVASPAFDSSPRREGSSSHSFSGKLLTRLNRKSKIRIETPQSLEERLIKAFAPTKDITIVLKTFESPSKLLTNANLSIEPLKDLLNHYKQISETLKRPHFDVLKAWALVEQKAEVNRFGQLTGLIEQTRAAYLCRVRRSGPLCFNVPDVSWSVAQTHLKAAPIGTIIFGPVSHDHPLDIGSVYMMPLLESLFGLPISEPSILMGIDNIRSKAPLNQLHTTHIIDPRERHSRLIGDYFHDQTIWGEKARFSYVLAQRKFEGITLGEFLRKVVLGQESLQKLDSPSFGSEFAKDFLFSLVTGATRPLENYGLTTVGAGKYTLTRTGPSSFSEDANNLISRRKINFLWFFYLANQPIPAEDKNNSLKNNVFFLLGQWLTGGSKFLTFHTDLTSKLPLSRSTDVQVHLGVDANVMPLIIPRYFQAVKILQTPNITYLEALKVLCPEDYDDYQFALKKASKHSDQRTSAMIFFGTIMLDTITQLRQMNEEIRALGEKEIYSTEELDLFSTLAQRCFTDAESSLDASFERVTVALPPNAKQFFQKRYDFWLKEQRGPEAHFMLKAWEVMQESRTLDKSNLQVGVSSSQSQPVSASQKREPIHTTLQNMIDELITQTDLDSMVLVEAIDIMDLLLTVRPKPMKYHPSWRKGIDIFRQCYCALPLSIKNFVEHLGLEPINEETLLLREHLERLHSYSQMTTSMVVSDSLPSAAQAAASQHLDVSAERPFSLRQQEERATLLLRRLIIGPLAIVQTDNRDIVEAIVDLFILPQHNIGNSIGFESFPEARGGIFRRQIEDGGDHFLLPWSHYWVRSLVECRRLTASMRSSFLTYPMIPLYLEWLHALKQTYPDIKLHPWFIKNSMESIKRFQHLLSTHYALTFAEIMEELLPGAYYFLQEKCKVYPTVKELLENRNNKLTAVESNSTNYGWVSSRGKTLTTILEEEDTQHWECYEIPSLNLDQAATQCLRHFCPRTAGIESIIHTLAMVSHFEIDLAQINKSAWRDKKILLEMLRINDAAIRMKCIELALALRMSCSPLDLRVQVSGLSLLASGFNSSSSEECHYDVLSELISLFPEVSFVSLPSNGIRSLDPLMDSLKGLTALRKLNLSDNRLHRPSPLSRLSQLEELTLKDTYIPKINLAGLRVLISQETRADSLPNLAESHYVNEQSGEGRLKDVLRYNPFHRGLPIEGPISVFQKLDGLMVKARKTSEDIDHIICLIQYLSESLWKETLMFVALTHHKLSYPMFFDLFQPPYDPRPSAFRLIYALTFNLPMCTNPNSLGFTDGKTDHLTCRNDVSCLNNLETLGTIEPPFFEITLPQFLNLIILKINGFHASRDILICFPRLPALKLLDLSRNNMTTLVGLCTNPGDRFTKFPLLESLDCSHNKLNTNDHISSNNGINFFLLMTNLKRLDLSHNQLTRMPMDVMGKMLLQLDMLDLRSNKISEVSGHVNMVSEGKQLYFTPQN